MNVNTLNSCGFRLSVVGVHSPVIIDTCVCHHSPISSQCDCQPQIRSIGKKTISTPNNSLVCVFCYACRAVSVCLCYAVCALLPPFSVAVFFLLGGLGWGSPFPLKSERPKADCNVCVCGGKGGEASHPLNGGVWGGRPSHP